MRHVLLAIAVAAACDAPQAQCSGDGWCEDQALLDWDYRHERPGFLGVRAFDEGVWVVGDYGWALFRNASTWDFVSTFTARPYYAVGGASVDDVWGVGARFLVEHIGAPEAYWPYSGPRLPRISSMVSFGASEIWAASTQGLVFHLEGETWLPVQIPNEGTTLYAIGGTGSSDVWVASARSIYHWNGEAWRLAFTFADDILLRTIWAGSREDAWVAGLNTTNQRGVIAHYHNGTWTTSELPSGGPIQSLWGSSASDVWGAAEQGLVHYDGASWSLAYASPRALFAVFGFSSTDVWAVGDAGVAVHFDGELVAHDTGATKSLRAVGGSAPNDLWAAGEDSQISRWNGQQWSRVPHTRWDFRGTTREHVFEETENQSLYALAATPDAIWLAGDDGAPLVWDGRIVAEHGGGATGLNRYAVAAHRAEDVWVAGDLGTMYRYDGTGWLMYRTGVDESLFGVWAIDSDHAWVVGDAGRVLQWNGRSWRPIVVDAPGWLRGVWASSAHDVWIAGEAGTMLRFDGTQWTRVDIGVSEHLHAIWGRAANDIYVVGDNGVLVHYDGVAWTRQSVPTSAPLFAIDGTADRTWAVGGRPCLGCGVVIQAAR